jgi:She9 / Mdm33 family
MDKNRWWTALNFRVSSDIPVIQAIHHIQERLSILKLTLARKYDGFNSSIKHLWPNLPNMDKLSSSISIQLNRLTGYDLIEELKRKVHEKDQWFIKLKKDFQTCQMEYQRAVDVRSSLQREIHSLLQRKSSWLEDEINRFTVLYRTEIKQEQHENTLKLQLENLNVNVDAAHTELMNAMRERYQLEQLWSDKIRKLSTEGTLLLVIVNILLFLSVQFFFEPRKRAHFNSYLETLVQQHHESQYKALDSRLSEMELRLFDKMIQGSVYIDNGINSVLTKASNNNVNASFLPILPGELTEVAKWNAASSIVSYSSLQQHAQSLLRHWRILFEGACLGATIYSIMISIIPRS